MKIIFLTIFFFLASSYRLQSDTLSLDAPGRVDPPFLEYQSFWVDSVMKSLTLEEKIAQLMMVAAYSNKEESHKEAITGLLKKYNIGGLIFFQGAPYKQAKLTNHYQEVAKTPLLIAMDAEWGLAMRLDSTISYPRQMMLGAITDNRLIYDMGKDIAKQMKRLGVHVNFAPVVDVNNNSANPVINSRSFGEDRENVFYKSMAYMIGMQDNGVIATAKHFPGHGDTDVDSHHALPVIKHNYSRLDSIELFPFKNLIQKGLGGVMIAHLNIPALDSTPNLASTLSKPIVTGLLKNKLGYKGLVFTDALGMKGVSKYYGPGEIAVNAFKAGNDVLLMPTDVGSAIKAISKEVKAGNIKEEDIDKRCRKIISAKEWVGLSDCKPIDINNLTSELNIDGYEFLQNKLTESAITLLQNKNATIPVKDIENLKVAAISLGDFNGNSFQESLDLYMGTDHFSLPKNPTQNQVNSLLKNVAEYDLLIAGIHNTSRYILNNYGISKKVVQTIDTLAKTGKLIMCHFANPYALSFYKNTSDMLGIVLAYEDSPLARNYAAQVIFGGMAARGKIPVSAGKKFVSGDGWVQVKRLRIKYGIPEEASMNWRQLTHIDTLVNKAMDEEAFPGCVVLVARKGIVCYHKAFGYHTYRQKRPMKTTDIFDIASVTKIAATTPVLMKLTDQGKFSVNDSLGKYIDDLGEDKDTLLISEILTHQSGLKSWIPFYMKTLEKLHNRKNIYSPEYTADYPFKLSETVYMNRNLVYREGAFSHMKKDNYSVEVGRDLYMNEAFVDTIWKEIYESELREERGYKYSDLGFYLMLRTIENITDTTLDYLAENWFYKPLGASTMCYKPLGKFSKNRIVPMENDMIFRRQLVQGYVHDPGAAMLGGVGGHAGVFANANDLAKLMQMYLNKGEYAGKRMLSEEVVELFTSCPYCQEGKSDHNRRGLGFDKPEMDRGRIPPCCRCVSKESFGHSGFTGAYTWADPEHDLVYVFLSNRIHPNQENMKIIKMNTRTDIQRVIYDAVVE